MVHLAPIVVVCLMAAIALAEDIPKKEKTLVKKDVDDLTTASSYGLGYGHSYPYYGYSSGLGSSHGYGGYGGYGAYGGYGGLGGYGGYGGLGGYGGYGKAYVIPVYNYGHSGLGYSKGYGGYGGYPYGYSGLGGGYSHSPYKSGYYGYPYSSSSYYSGHHGLGGYY